VTIARLAETYGAANTAAGNYDTAIAAPASPPDGACVIILQNGSAADLVTSVQYGTGTGAVALTERRFVPKVTEAGVVYFYWGAGVTLPAGAQTIRVVRTGTAQMQAAVCPMTVAAGMEVAVDVDVATAVFTSANPAWAMTTVATPTECYLGVHSGLTTMTTTPAANWTLIGSTDAGAAGYGCARRTMAAAGNAAPGWTASTSDDWIGASIAFKEAALAVPPSEPPGQLMRSPRPSEQFSLYGPFAPPSSSTILPGG